MLLKSAWMAGGSAQIRIPLYMTHLQRIPPGTARQTLVFFFLNIEMQHCQRPIVENRPYCVLPGDVVVPRIPPLHASLVSESNHRHPVDGNCYIVRGMNPGDAAWLLALLNEKEFEAWFMARSGSQILPRIGLKDLRNCPFPDPPEGVPRWSTRLFDWVERYSSNANRLFSLQSEVSSHVSEYLSDQDEQKHRLFPGVREPSVLLAGDSWLPVHVESEYQQRGLIEKGALRLKDLVVRAAPSSARLREEQSSMVRLLKIADVTGIYLPSVEASLSETRLGRFFAEPVRSAGSLGFLAGDISQNRLWGPFPHRRDTSHRSLGSPYISRNPGCMGVSVILPCHERPVSKTRNRVGPAIHKRCSVDGAMRPQYRSRSSQAVAKSTR